MKEFLGSPKKTAILGLVGSLIMLISMFLYSQHFLISTIYNVCFIGLIIYFVIILSRMFKHRGNIKFANYILIITFIISILASIILGILEGEFFTLDDLLLIIITLYFSKILLRKVKLINNNAFAIIVIGLSIYQLIRYGSIIFSVKEIEILDLSYFIKHLTYITIVPYFYNYYELLKGGK